MNASIGFYIIFAGLVVLVLGYGAFELFVGRKRRAELARMASAAENTSAAVLILDHDAVIEWANGALTTLTGYAVEEAIGKTPAALLLGGGQTSALVQKFREGLSSGQSFFMEMHCAHRAGHQFWLTLDVTPIFNKDSELTHYIVLGSDVTPRKQAEEELARLSRRNELFLYAVNEGIFGIDAQGQITFANPAAGRFTGWEADGLIGQPASTIIQQLRIEKLPDSQDNPFAALAFFDGVVLMGDADFFRRSDGSVFPVEYNSAPVVEGSEIVGAVVVFRDTSERQQSESLRLHQGRQDALRADIGLALAGRDTLKGILYRCAHATVDHLDGAFAKIWTLSPDEQTLELQVTAGTCQPHDHDQQIPIGTGKVGSIARDRLPQVVNDVQSDPFFEDHEWLQTERIVAFVGFPLFVENRLVGVLALFSRSYLPNRSEEHTLNSSH